MKFFKKTSIISCYHFSSSVPHSTDLFGSVTLSAVTGGSCRSLASTVPILFRYPFGAPLRSHLLYLSVPFLSALRNVLCKTSMINTLFLIAFAYSYSSTGNPDCQCSFVSLLLIAVILFPPVSKRNMPEAWPQFLRVWRSPLRYKALQAAPDPLLRCSQR